MKAFLITLAILLSISGASMAANVPNGCYVGLVEHVSNSQYDYDATVCVLVGTPIPSYSHYDYFNLNEECDNTLTYLYDRGSYASYFYEYDSDPDLCVSGSVYMYYIGFGCAYYAWYWPSGALDGDGVLCK